MNLIIDRIAETAAPMAVEAAAPATNALANGLRTAAAGAGAAASTMVLAPAAAAIAAAPLLMGALLGASAMGVGYLVTTKLAIPAAKKAHASFRFWSDLRAQKKQAAAEASAQAPANDDTAAEQVA